MVKKKKRNQKIYIKYECTQDHKDAVTKACKDDGRSVARGGHILMDEVLVMRKMAATRQKGLVKALRKKEPVPSIDEILGTTEKH